MKLQLFVLCCVLQSIVGFNIRDFIIYPPALNSNRIVGGEDAPEGLAPYQCSIKVDGVPFCGCAILSSEWLITSSACVVDQSPENIEIVIGTIDLNEGGTRYEIEKFIMHEKYNQPRYANDIAVIKVKGKIEFNDNVQPIEMDTEEVEEGTKLLLTGFGRVGDDDEFSHKLQMIKLNAVQTQKCKESFADLIGPDHFCTFNKEGEGACNGDAGGPLVLGKKLVGIVNFGVPCGLGFPDVHAKISYLYGWVLEKTGL